MKNKKVGIAIGISVYNEANNIEALLNSLLKQKNKSFNLEKILIVIDGSTDQTFNKIKKVKSPLLQIINGEKRLGKSTRTNQIFSLLENEIVLLLDGDIHIYDDYLIEELIKPMLNNKNIQLTAGNDIPVNPKNWTERIANKGIQIWKDVRDNKKNADIYYCGGPVRAFGKKLYKKIILPDSSQENSYAFLFCIQEGFEFKYAESAKIYYRTPSILIDFAKQTLRFLQSEKVQKNYFGDSLVRRYYVINNFDRLGSLMRNIIKDPLFTAQFFLFDLIMKVVNLFMPIKDGSVWENISSTKEKIN